MSARTAREFLNSVKWSGARTLNDVTLVYADRTSETGTKIIEGVDIVGMERRYFEKRDRHEDTTVRRIRLPYYKILEILVDGVVRWKRSDSH